MENKIEYTSIFILKTEEQHLRQLVVEFAKSIGCEILMDKTIVREYAPTERE